MEPLSKQQIVDVIEGRGHAPRVPVLYSIWMNAEPFQGDRICILAGFDVQRVIPYGTEEDVRAEVRWLMDTYRRKDGRFMLTMGNGATADWKVCCLDALYGETLEYGTF